MAASNLRITIDSDEFRWTTAWLRIEAIVILVSALGAYRAVDGSWISEADPKVGLIRPQSRRPVRTRTSARTA